MTKFQFYTKMIISSLSRRRSRMVVALLAVTIGSTILSGLVTIFLDVPRQMGKEMRNYGANFIITGKEGSFTYDSLNKALAVIPKDNLIGYSPYKYLNVKINQQPFVACGTDFESIKLTSPYWYINGHYPLKDHEVILGLRVANYLRASVGDSLKLTGLREDKSQFDTRIKVTGILQTGSKEEDFIYMSLKDIKALSNYNNLDLVQLSLSMKVEDLNKLQSLIEDSSIKGNLVKRLTQSEDTVLSKFQYLVLIVTIIILLLTNVCVSTTMMAVVQERRKEIGLKKALGAFNREIIWDFMGESILLGIVGGIFGVVLGYFFSQGVSISVFCRKVDFIPVIIPLTIICSILITTLSSLIPVMSSTKVDPAVVLKGE